MWKQVQFSDGRYLINEEGEMYNIVSNKYIHPSIFQNGYKVATLTDTEHNRRKFLLHRLVAQTFIPNPNNYPIVMHLDNNPLNCNVDNLQWGTYSENNAQAIKDGLNKIPRPDNRKMYVVDVENSPISFDCFGVKSVIDLIGFGNDSCIRNYIHRNARITKGQFKGWKIQKKE